MIENQNTVRVRFAPSPTGYLHIGGMRTAFFNYLFAKANNGKFILRIEDTDQNRFVKDALEDIIVSLKWMDVFWDEGPEIGGDKGPYFQSARTEIYQEHAKKLINEGKAYYCYCSQERLDKIREEQKENQSIGGYDRKCRNLTPEQQKEFEAQGIKPVIRFKTPLEGKTTFNDAIRGEVSFENKNLDDCVLLKSDGFPTYHLANVIDDQFMDITHVLRGEEWIPSTPRHILLYKSFDYKPPIFAHLPVILSPNGGKLSKRDGATNMRQFIDQGYIKEAMANFLALLGWSYDDSTEFFTIDELKQYFSLDKIGKGSPTFSYEKLNWFNGKYIRKLSVEDLTNGAIPFIQKAGLIEENPSEETYNYLLKIIPLIQEKITTLAEIPSMINFFFANRLDFSSEEDLLPVRKKKKMPKDDVIKVLEATLNILEKADDFSVESLENSLRGLTESLGMGAGKIFMPIRIAITGSIASPGLFESISVLGKDKTIKRLQDALEILK